jgi:uncharacterized membrane protein YbhN (UPF0104 family)
MDLKMSSLLRRSLQILGIVITILALGFAIQRILSIGHSNWEKLIGINVIVIIVLMGVAHGANYFLMAWAWQRMLVWFGEVNAKPLICMALYARTQIAKYLPGNFFHYPGRHVMGNRAGLHHPPLVGAMLYEIMGCLVAAGALSLVVFPKSILIGNSIIFRIALIPLILIIPLLIQYILIHFSIGRRFGFPEKTVWEAFIGLMPIWAIYLVFFMLEGLILWGIIGGTTGQWLSVPFLYIISAFTIPWVIGFITPGAPAGLGVRDALMILILTNFMGAPAAAFVALISRLVVTLGDVIFFLLSFPLAQKSGLQLVNDVSTVQPGSRITKKD